MTHGGDLFAIARQRGWDWREVLDLSASINPLGPAPGVRPAIEAALERIAHYPGQATGELEEALAAEWRISPAQVMAGGGATELLHFVARAGWNGPAALVTPVWSEFYRAFPHALRAPLNDPERWPQRGLLVLSQPVNPTGEAVAVEILRRAIAGREGPVLIDESFIEFTRLESAVGWTEHHPNLLVLRSLSKFHGLPGLRVGALAGSREWMDRLARRREPWQVGTLAEAAALAALSDREHAERTREVVETERNWLLEALSGLDGLRFSEGVANFLFAGTDRPAREICDWFLERKIILRNCSGLPGVEGEAIRFAVRTREENERFVAAAKEYFCGG
ncbi:MAG: aminotransferase class I/II-fold pyridoxal phosphate-dependent enzyme [Acidobacteria bacterium]|nr:aminotransferase class I/II-fold pyridoxal phosphate-dependent enzyme [Acidobacteriota bacterium]